MAIYESVGDKQVFVVTLPGWLKEWMTLVYFAKGHGLWLGSSGLDSHTREWKAWHISLSFLIESETALNIGIFCCEWLLR